MATWSCSFLSVGGRVSQFLRASLGPGSWLNAFCWALKPQLSTGGRLMWWPSLWDSDDWREWAPQGVLSSSWWALCGNTTQGSCIFQGHLEMQLLKEVCWYLYHNHWSTVWTNQTQVLIQCGLDSFLTPGPFPIPTPGPQFPTSPFTRRLYLIVKLVLCGDDRVIVLQFETKSNVGMSSPVGQINGQPARSSSGR